MNTTWINRDNNPKCILFFNGWGMDENSVKHLDFQGFDICMFNNYKVIERINDDLSNYREIFVVAWSLGVWAASQVLSKSDIETVKKIAINGTEKPIDDMYGIPKEVFRGTLTGWDVRNRNKFNMRVLGGRDNFRDFSVLLSSRSVDDQKSELQSIWENVEKKNTSEFEWDKVIIGDKDMIFTSLNQVNWWSGKTEIVKKDIPHFPFVDFSSWGEILS
jgi:biotin synthesis protein BioG